MHKREQIQKMLSRLSPDQQAIARDYARMKLENANLIQALKETKEAYESIYKPFITIIHAYPDHVCRIHESQFLRFKDEYRIESRFDEETREMVYTLKTLTD
jgi:tRNA-dihydrouridine synthase